MAIITISRELATLGDECARELAARLGYRLVDKNVIEERIVSYGVSSRKFQKYDEKKPSFWSSLSHDRDDYLHFLKNVLLTEAEVGNAIFVGRGAGVILKGTPALVSVFLTAPLEIRIERVKSYFHCDNRRAQQIIEQSDSDREGFHGFFFDANWKASENYHLTLNTGYLSPELCADMVKLMCDKIITESDEAKNSGRIRELIIGQRIKQCILYEKQVKIHFLEVSVLDKSIILYGVVNAKSLIDEAVSAAKDLEPSFSVQSEIQVVQEFSIMP